MATAGRPARPTGGAPAPQPSDARSSARLKRAGVDRGEADGVLLAGRGARAPRLLGDRPGYRGGDVAVEHPRDDVVLAQLALRDDVRDPAAAATRIASVMLGADVERAAEDAGKARTLLIWLG